MPLSEARQANLVTLTDVVEAAKKVLRGKSDDAELIETLAQHQQQMRESNTSVVTRTYGVQPMSRENVHVYAQNLERTDYGVRYLGRSLITQAAPLLATRFAAGQAHSSYYYDFFGYWRPGEEDYSDTHFLEPESESSHETWQVRLAGLAISRFEVVERLEGERIAHLSGHFLRQVAGELVRISAVA